MLECILKARENKRLTPEEARDLTRLWNSFENQYTLEMGVDAGYQRAREALLERLRAEAAERKRVALIRERVARRQLDDMLGHRNAAGKQDLAEAVLSHFERTGWASFSSVDGRAEVILKMAQGDLAMMLAEFERTAGTGRTRNIPRLKNVVRELFGNGTGDAKAAAIADAWRRVSEALRERYNAAGGHIGQLENWGLPQYHDPTAIVNAGREEWKAFIEPLLDREKMRHPLTGQRLTDDELDETLETVYKNIITGGWDRREPQHRPQGHSSLASKHADHRFLHFADADGWMKYADRFGGHAGWDREDVALHAMMNHLRTMSHDIATLEVIGPNPAATMEWMGQLLDKELSRLQVRGQSALSKTDLKGAARQVDGAKNKMNRLWEAWSGALDVPENATIAAGGAVLRNLNVSSKLGSAFITALSDPGFQTATRMFAGADNAGPLRVISDVASMFLRKNRHEAVQASLGLDSAIHMIHQESRYFGTITGPQWSRWLADRTLTWSLLQPMTQAGKHAWGMNFFATMANHARYNFRELGEVNIGGFSLRSTLEQYGIGEFEWSIIRRAQPHEPRRDARFIRPQDIARVNHPEAGRIAERYLEMVLDIGRKATPESTLGTTSLLKAGTRPGTVTGEVMRAVAMFKSFPVAIIALYGGQIQRELLAGQVARGAVYAGSTLILTTIMAGASLQLAEISKGRDPRNMNNPKFWGAAMLKGGGLGLFGDFLFADHNRYGGGFFKSLAGPVPATLDNLAGLTLGNLSELAQGKDTHMGRETVKFLRRELPLGSLWYARAAWERIFLNQLQSVLDPDAHKSFRRQKQYYEKNFEQDFYWEPDDVLPSRGPAFSQAWK